MIIDNAKNMDWYKCLGRRMTKAIEAIPTLLDADIGKYEIDGEDIYAYVQEYETKLPGEARLEAHRKYVDIQYIVSGTELMETCLLKNLETEEDYCEEKDVEFFKAPKELCRAVLSDGDFAIFYPDDVHAPGQCVDAPSPVRKILIKISV